MEVELALEDMGKPIGVADYKLIVPKKYWLYQEHIHTEKERHIVLYPSALNFGDFNCKIKQKTLSMFSPTISPVEQCKYTFLFNMTL